MVLSLELIKSSISPEPLHACARHEPVDSTFVTHCSYALAVQVFIEPTTEQFGQDANSDSAFKENFFPLYITHSY